MDYLLHAAIFFVSAGIIWFFSGLLVDAIERVAKRFQRSGFTVAFFVLGFLTSISEISVMVNATLKGTPEVSAGNVVGGSIVLLLCVVPFIAIFGQGISLRNSLSSGQMALVLGTILLPALFLMDGEVTRFQGLLSLLGYVVLLYLMQRPRKGTIPEAVEEVVEEVEQVLIQKKHTTTTDCVTMIVGGLCIFLAGHGLVSETIYFADVFGVSAGLVALIVLSVSTNVPELVIGLRAIRKKQTAIAFGDYLGSAASNPAIFGVLVLVNGPFVVESVEFFAAFVLSLLGFVLLFIFAKTSHFIARWEGIVLLGLYVTYIVYQSVQMYV